MKLAPNQQVKPGLRPKPQRENLWERQNSGIHNGLHKAGDGAHDTCRDFGHAYAAWVACGEEDLDGLGAEHHFPQESFNPTARLNTGLPAVWSTLSATK